MQSAKSMGARVAIASKSGWKLEKALEHGADAAISDFSKYVIQIGE